ncbi:hypothetical protein TEA_020942 [Camellia sinensis var. sinensis]|uniref:Reticulon-like protein n=1 Tax=Camellia sinensis var. sinensis TaxID=542762 RepID=A0A4S4EUA1_CAMSN|nr:hypothetical protein TEA_020942 [Camellia sinensis var. sinensis]
MSSSSLDSDDGRIRVGKPIGRHRTTHHIGGGKNIHHILGGGKVADVLLWKDKKVSAAILMGISIIWFLFEVVEYNFLTLLCHLIISTILIIFIWNKVADSFQWNPPRIPEFFLDKYTFREVADIFHAKMDQFESNFFYVACGNDFRHFILEEVDYYVGRVNRRMRKSYKKFDKEVLTKIPRGPVKEHKDK